MDSEEKDTLQCSTPGSDYERRDEVLFSDIIVWSRVHWLTNNCHPTTAAPASLTSIIDAHSSVLNTWEPFFNCPRFTADTLPSSLPMVYLGQCLSDIVVELFICHRSTSAAAPIIAPRCWTLGSLFLTVPSLLQTLSLPHCTSSVPQTLSWSCSFIATQLVQLLPSSLLSVEHSGASFLNCPWFTPDTFPSCFLHLLSWLSLSGNHPHCPSPLTPKSLIYCRHFPLLTACNIPWVLFPLLPLGGVLSAPLPMTIIIHPLRCWTPLFRTVFPPHHPCGITFGVRLSPSHQHFRCPPEQGLYMFSFMCIMTT